MTAREPWFSKYEQPGRSGQVAILHTTGPKDWLRDVVEHARKEAASEAERDY